MIHVSEQSRPGLWLLPLALIVGLGAGIGVGLTVSWWLWPVEYTDVAPQSLRPSHREEYIVLIGQAYHYDQDQNLARARLAGLGDPTTLGAEIATLAEKRAAEGGRAEYIQALTALAYALGHQRAALAAYLPANKPTATWTVWVTVTPTASASPTPREMPAVTPTPTPAATSTDRPTVMPTLTPTATPTRPRAATPTTVPGEIPTASPTHTVVLPPEPTQPRPTLISTPIPSRMPKPTNVPTMTPGPEPRFELVQQRRTCEGAGGQLRVSVRDVAGQPEPNVELLIRWTGGEDRFFTGLKPEIGAGYADFDMQEGEGYQVVVIGMESDVARGIVADACVEQGHLASWDIVFQLSSEPPP